MTAYDEYVKLLKKAAKVSNDEEYSALVDVAVDIRNKEFTKEDWKQLIANTNNGRAKFEYAKMMNAKFPDQ